MQPTQTTPDPIAHVSQDDLDGLCDALVRLLASVYQRGAIEVAAEEEWADGA